jgi:hypothetical protein
MAVNVPSYDVEKFSFGPGILSLVAITDTSGVTQESDLVDIGGVRSGGTFNVSRTRLDVNQGSPATLVKTFVTAETATLSVTSIEWDLSNLSLALGAGVVNEGASPEKFGFGGDLNITDCAVKLEHVMPIGWTLTIRLWRAQGQGELNLTFGDDLHEIPYTFNALQTALAWGDGATGSLTASEQLFRINLQK